jgi:hypothetical protein
MDIKQRLHEVTDKNAHYDFSDEGINFWQLCYDALAEIERLEAGPRHKKCVYPPVNGYPHESGCVGCRIEKTCTECGHFVDLSSKHR